MMKSALVLGVLLLLSATVSAQSVTACTTGSLIHNGEKWTVNCVGSCPAGGGSSTPCRVKKKEFEGIFTKFCSCNDATQGDPSVCCHVILVDGEPDKTGNCGGSCGSGACTWSEEPPEEPEDGDSLQASCQS